MSIECNPVAAVLIQHKQGSQEIVDEIQGTINYAKYFGYILEQRQEGGWQMKIGKEVYPIELPSVRDPLFPSKLRQNGKLISGPIQKIDQEIDEIFATIQRNVVGGSSLLSTPCCVQ